MSDSLNSLINIFAKFPSLGNRSARRIVLYLLKRKENLIPILINQLSNLKDLLSFCKICGNIDTCNPCQICEDQKRKFEKICVVEDVGDLFAIEKSKAYDGHYHVLGGVLSAIDGVGPEDLSITSLFDRINKHEIKEIILATNATVEGQITAQYISENCPNKKVLITRLAQGMPVGAELDVLDLNTLSTAFSSRLQMK